MERTFRWLVPALSVALVVTLALLVATIVRPAGIPVAQAADPAPTGLTVVGQGVVKVKPDVAYVNLSVITTEQTAQDATAQNATLMTQVMDKLNAIGIAKDDIRTAGVTIYPIIQYDPKDANKGKITGYRAENSIIVTTAVDKAGQVFDEGVKAGANQSSSMTFGLRDDSKYRQQALVAAVKAARSDADTLAGALGLTIKEVKNVQVQYGGSKVDVTMAGGTRQAAPDAPPTPVNPGELTITASVQVTYSY